MDYADCVARLGRQQFRDSPQRTATSPPVAPTRERIKNLLQTYVAAAEKVTTSTIRRKPVSATNQTNLGAQGFKKWNQLLLKNGDTPADTLNRLGRLLISKKEVLTKEEAYLFIRGDPQLGRMGLVQLCSVSDKALASAAIVLLDELLLDDEVEHPSRDNFTEAFVSMGFQSLTRELCLDIHVLNEDTRYAAFRVALAVGIGNNDTLPVLFRNQRAALDLYVRWMQDQEGGGGNDDDEASSGSVMTGSAADGDGDDIKGRVGRKKQPVVGDDIGPKTWDEIGTSVDEDFDTFFDDDDSNRLLMMGSSSTSLASGSFFEPSERDAHMMNDGGGGVISVEDWDPLRLKNSNAGSFTAKRKVAKLAANPEELLERMYPNATRSDLARGLAHLEREVMTRDIMEQKLVHDRLIDLVKVRQAVDSLASSTEVGSGFAKKAFTSLRTAKNVSDLSLGPLLAREDNMSQVRKALQIVTERPSSTFLLEFSRNLDDLVEKQHYEEAVSLIKRYMEDELKRGKRIGAFGEATTPLIFQKAVSANETSIKSFVRSIESKVETVPTVDLIRTFIDLREIVPDFFTVVKSARGFDHQQGEQEEIRDTDQMLLSIALQKAEKVCTLMSTRYEQTASELAERSSRAKVAVLDLSSNFKSDCEPDSIPANVSGRYKTVRNAAERYASTALSIFNQVLKLALDYLEWTQPLDRFGVELDRVRSSVVERCVDILTTISFDTAPPSVSGEISVVLNVARLAESLWQNSVPGSNRTVASSESSLQSGSQASSQYRSFNFIASQGNIPWYAAGVIDSFTMLNRTALTRHSGFVSVSKKVTEATIDYVMDELVATLDAVNKNLPSMNIEALIPDAGSMVGDLEKDDDGKQFCVPLMEHCWTFLNTYMRVTIEPMLESCGERLEATLEALQVKERITKAARSIGTILGRCAEQYRIRGDDASGKGFLLLARDCQILKRRVLKNLKYCDINDLQVQFDRLEPALATQYLKACSLFLSEKVHDALAGTRDPLTGLRFVRTAGGDAYADYANEIGPALSVSERWISIVHSVAESVGECEAFLGSRYAAKLKTGLARAVGARILGFLQTDSSNLDLERCRCLQVDVSFVERILHATGEDLGFTKSLAMLSERTKLMDYDIESYVELAMTEWSWLTECFVRF